MKNKHYTVEFKIRAVELLKSRGGSQESVAKELGIAGSTLSEWSQKYEAGLLQHVAPNKVQSSSDKEIARLTAELKRKTMEVEILKKATAFFAKENL
jgi:transposase